jgi:hypothetical protein
MVVGDDASAKADLEQVYRLLAENRPVADPGLLRRIRERSEAARRAVFDRNGLLEVAVPAIRAPRSSGRRGRMRYVLDSNVAVKWILEENLSDKARRIIRLATTAMHVLSTLPPLSPAQCMSCAFCALFTTQEPRVPVVRTFPVSVVGRLTPRQPR